MIIVDKQIKERVSQGQLIVENYKEENVGAVSYDITLDKVITEDGEKNTYELVPGEVVYVKSLEKIKIPENMMGRVTEKNSRMRQGLVVAAPCYQPGHTTYMFLRIQNVSADIITIRSGIQIAQIMFETLAETPDVPYNQNTTSSYNDETQYIRFGRYESEYKADMKKYQAVKEDLENKETKIYANILTLMGIFISMFSLVAINFGSLTQNNMSPKYMCVMNVSLSLVITVMLGIILIFLNKAKNKKFLAAYCVLLAILVIAFIVLCITIL